MNIKIKKVIKLIIVCILLAIPLLAIKNTKDSMYVQNAAMRWDSTGKSVFISVFFSKDEKISETNTLELEEQIKDKLLESDALEDEYTYVYSYNAKSAASISSENGTKEVEAYGIGGNFFVFHPMELSGGSYFNPDENHSLVVIDEDVAWTLFGSVDVEGMEVEINGKQHVVAGVIKRDEGMLNKIAGNTKPSIYLSYMSLKEIDENISITNYEIIMPNLTKGYAKKIIKGYFLGGSSDMGFGESETSEKNENIVIVENSERFKIIPLLSSLKTFFGRSMKQSTVVYPYWENVARGVEEILLILLFLEIIVIIYVMCKIIAFIRKVVKNITRKYEIDAVIFDIGNVLAEFIPEEFLRRLKFSEEKIEYLMENVIESDIWNEYDKGTMDRDGAVAALIEKCPEAAEDIKKIFTNFNGIVKRFTHTDLWIDDLKNKGKRVYYLSNISDALYNDCRAELNFVDDTDGGILSFEALCSKPDEKIYKMLIEKYKLNPEKCLFVDDRQKNIEAAEKAGLHGVIFTNYLEVNKQISKKYIL